MTERHRAERQAIAREADPCDFDRLGPTATRQQLSADDSSFLTVAKDILEEDGPSGLWRGLRPGLVLTVNPAITYGAFERSV